MEDFDWELSREAALAAARELRSSGATSRNRLIEAVAKALEDAVTICIEDEPEDGRDRALDAQGFSY